MFTHSLFWRLDIFLPELSTRVKLPSGRREWYSAPPAGHVWPRAFLWFWHHLAIGPEYSGGRHWTDADRLEKARFTRPLRCLNSPRAQDATHGTPREPRKKHTAQVFRSCSKLFRERALQTVIAVFILIKSKLNETWSKSRGWISENLGQLWQIKP